MGEDTIFGQSGIKGDVGRGLEKKINLSVRVENDITRSEKKGEKRPNYYGRDDRATQEQVLDPRTRMILFKLLNSNFLELTLTCMPIVTQMGQATWTLDVPLQVMLS